MATHSNSLGIKLITTGDESGTWGDSSNTNFDIIDAGFSYGTFDFSSDANITLTVGEFDTGDPAGFMVLIITDTGVVLTTGRDVTFAPGDCTKMWVVTNSTAQTLTFKQGSAGTSVALLAAQSAVLYADGAGAVNGDIVNALDNLTVTTVTGHIINTDVQAFDAFLQSIATKGTGADKYIYTSGVDTAEEGTITTLGRNLIDDATTGAMHITLALIPGTDVQVFDAGLLSIAGLTTLADRMIYTTASDVYAVATLTSAGRDLLDDADAAAQRVTLNLAGGGAVTDNRLVKTDGTTGYQWQETGIVIDDNNIVSGGGVKYTEKTDDYTLVLGDAGEGFSMNNASAKTFTIPADGGVAFVVGTRIEFMNVGAGLLTIAITTDTLNSAGGGLRDLAQYEAATATKMTSTMWVLTGGLS